VPRVRVAQIVRPVHLRLGQCVSGRLIQDDVSDSVPGMNGADEDDIAHFAPSSVALPRSAAWTFSVELAYKLAGWMARQCQVREAGSRQRG